MLHNILNAFTGDKSNRHQVEGTVVLMKKSVLDFNDFTASMLDGLHEFVGKGVSLQLVSTVNTDSGYFISFLFSLLFFMALALCFCMLLNYNIIPFSFVSVEEKKTSKSRPLI